LAEAAPLPTPFRRAVRVVCLDALGRVFLQRWRDPGDDEHVVWEPPGGGVEDGEDEHAAAVREVLEETGMAATLVPGRSVVVRRDVVWNGRRHVGPEPFLLARVDAAAPVAPDALSEVERATLLDARWLTWPEVLALTDPLEPPTLGAVLAALDPTGPWAVDKS